MNIQDYTKVKDHINTKLGISDPQDHRAGIDIIRAIKATGVESLPTKAQYAQLENLLNTIYDDYADAQHAGILSKTPSPLLWEYKIG